MEVSWKVKVTKVVSQKVKVIWIYELESESGCKIRSQLESESECRKNADLCWKNLEIL